MTGAVTPMDCFSDAGDAAAIALVTESGFDDWLAGQPEAVRAWIDRTGFTPKPGRHLALPPVEGAPAVVAAVGDPPSLWDTAGLSAGLPPGLYTVPDVPDADLARIALSWALGAYRFRRYKTETEPSEARPRLLLPEGPARVAALAQAEAVYLGRDLITTPAADMGPAELETAIHDVAVRHPGATVEVIRGATLLERNFPMIHAVGRASTRAPRLIDLRWGKAGPSVVLVGKGVCFDTGGLDLKPSSGMKLMKKDMGGAAIVLAVADALMATAQPIRLRVLIPAVENAVSGDAMRPLDVLTSRSGMTVEVGNTDAEGRLILADALTLACEDEPPALLVDCATLTGAARVALGTDLPALFATDDGLADALLDAGRRVEDPLWRMPLHAPYDPLIDSKVADMSSISEGGFGGAITAALFLKRFVPDSVPWMHLDAMAWTLSGKPGRPEGGEPMGARALTTFVSEHFGNVTEL